MPYDYLKNVVGKMDREDTYIVKVGNNDGEMQREKVWWLANKSEYLQIDRNNLIMDQELACKLFRNYNLQCYLITYSIKVFIG